MEQLWQIALLLLVAAVAQVETIGFVTLELDMAVVELQLELILLVVQEELVIQAVAVAALMVAMLVVQGVQELMAAAAAAADWLVVEQVPLHQLERL